MTVSGPIIQYGSYRRGAQIGLGGNPSVGIHSVPHVCLSAIHGFRWTKPLRLRTRVRTDALRYDAALRQATTWGGRS